MRLNPAFNIEPNALATPAREPANDITSSCSRPDASAIREASHMLKTRRMTRTADSV